LIAPYQSDTKREAEKVLFASILVPAVESVSSVAQMNGGERKFALDLGLWIVFKTLFLPRRALMESVF
jgi:hypothetical protein